MVTVLNVEAAARLEGLFASLRNERIKFMFTQKSLMLIYHEMIKIGYHMCLCECDYAQHTLSSLRLAVCTIVVVLDLAATKQPLYTYMQIFEIA